MTYIFIDFMRERTPRRLGGVVWASVLIAWAVAAGGCRHLPSAGTNAGREPGVTGKALSATNMVGSAGVEDGAATAESSDPYEQMRQLTRAMAIVRQDYVDPGRTEYPALFHGAVDGMLQSLDPYSQYLDTDSYQEIKDDTSGEFGGLGIVVGVKDGAMTVIAPMEDTPAYRAGILAGDRIAEIDGARTDSMSLRDGIRRLRGEKGSRVRLRVQREDGIKDVTIVRDVIAMTSVKGTRLLEGAIGYIRIAQFSETTATNLLTAIESLRAKGMRALALDLRNNPGGLLTAAVETAEQLLPKGAVIVATRRRPGLPNPPPAVAGGRVHLTDFPLAVLINPGSASAAEILAGALQDNRRAVLIGDVSFGKGLVQTILPLEDGSAIRLTTARYYTPAGRMIHETGIEPDILVPVSAEEWAKVQDARARQENPARPEKGRTEAKTLPDRQLERALDVLTGLLALRPAP